MVIVNDRSMVEDFVIPNYVEEVNEGHPRASFPAYLQWGILHLEVGGIAPPLQKDIRKSYPPSASA